MKKFSLIALLSLAAVLLATAVYLLIERQSGGEAKSCSVNSDCDNGHYCIPSTGMCHLFVDRHGRVPIGASGSDGGLMADMTADNYDDDGDGFCETAPCVGSLNPVFQVNELRGGDCDDNPSDGERPTVGSDSGAFKMDGSNLNHPGATDWKGDNCDGVVDGALGLGTVGQEEEANDSTLNSPATLFFVECYSLPGNDCDRDGYPACDGLPALGQTTCDCADDPRLGHAAVLCEFHEERLLFLDRLVCPYGISLMQTGESILVGPHREGYDFQDGGDNDCDGRIDEGDPAFDDCTWAEHEESFLVRCPWFSKIKLPTTADK